jgi:glutamate-5-semialdehyde dehydrogenase
MSDLISIGMSAKKASAVLSNISTPEKNTILLNIANAILENENTILNANQMDIENAKSNNTKPYMIDRLTLNSKRIEDIRDGIFQVIALPDPVGEVDSMWMAKNGLQIGKQRVPLGVVGIIYESRPNVTVETSTLCLKSGNAVVLRGGSDAINSNKAIIKVINDAIKKTGYDECFVQLIEDTDKETAQAFMRLNQYVDVLIPRGGAGLIQSVVKNATVPIIETGVGNCHIYVDSESDQDMAIKIIVNAKTSRPSVCNACESLLVDEKIYHLFLPKILTALNELGVEIRGCEKTQEIFDWVIPATIEDWATEYLDYIISVKVVADIDQAIQHINTYGTGHSEAIITTNYTNSRKFLKEVDASAVYVNASTRFTDGMEFGFGAEIGISTQKLHARGPIGLKELTSVKYIIFGDGHIR